MRFIISSSKETAVNFDKVKCLYVSETATLGEYFIMADDDIIAECSSKEKGAQYLMDILLAMQADKSLQKDIIFQAEDV